ncbi:hypothetical protein TCAL_13609 [Tigriopus californicus]|uniref:DNA ligase n=1 Tax=Tigriopus californicus TaxID=6832 RepID=A0A553PLT6_TIGCA|nr:DNA ligase 3-like [Tigriopus californicus]TRY78644.1 hypothetical protein TCAL_13609 [Tigriopus californicus]
MSDNRYGADYAKRVANCKKCKAKIDKGQLRLAKITANNPFSDGGGDMKLYHHPQCLFDTFKRARPATKIIEEIEDIEDFTDLTDEDKALLKQLIKDNPRATKGATPTKKAPPKPKATPPSPLKSPSTPAPQSSDPPPPTRSVQGEPNHKDNGFRQFRKICARLAEEPSYNAKTEIIRQFLTRGTDQTSFKGDLYVWVRLLLPGTVKRVYNLQSKQLVKIFSRIFGTIEEDMLEHLEAGDVADTIAEFFEQSKRVRPNSKANLTLHQVDQHLEALSQLTREDDQQTELTQIAEQCTSNDLKMVIRLVKHDLRIHAGAKHILDGLHPDAYDAFNSSRNIMTVLDKVVAMRKSGQINGPLEVATALMHPVQPMLAMACKSVDMAFQKCPNGMYSEIKYDGERVQLHKQGSDFKYFSRSLKPVLPHKVKHFKDFIPKAFPDGSDLILDAEVLMVDNKTGDPLPFGSLGVHKGAGFKDATPCLFVFDCLYYNGQSLLQRPIQERRKHLLDHMVEVGNHIKFSEALLITKKQQLGDMIKRVLTQGLEGLVLKDLKSVYEPGKRHWLKVKKDYLNDGAMADSADLVVLGAWYGSGNKGGIMSIFLMGCLNHAKTKWHTVTKVHTGLDDNELERVQKELEPNMEKIKGDYSKIPNWLDCTRQMTPDFVAKDPKCSPVWEITGAEFTKAEIHTASGISIRFPRITKQRKDKTWQTATSLGELKALFKASKENVDFDIDYSSESSPKKEVKSEPKSESPSAKPSPKINQEPLIPTVSSTNGRSFQKTHIKAESSGFELTVKTGDLFTQPGANESLAHCISQDCKLGKGIAKLFREKFGRISEIQACNAGIGEVAPLKEGQRFVYNLVTKAKYHQKPTYESLRQSLESMKTHALSNGVKRISMPKIGCGLDGLNWNAVRTLIKNVFLSCDIQITIYFFGQDDQSSTPIKKVATSPMKKKTPTKRSSSDEDDYNASTDEEDQKTAPPKVKVEKLDLPDLFVDMKIRLVEGVSLPKKMERFVVAYGGEILSDFQVGEATHVIYPKGSRKKELLNNAPTTALHLKDTWLQDSIKRQKLAHIKSHTIA